MTLPARRSAVRLRVHASGALITQASPASVTRRLVVTRPRRRGPGSLSASTLVTRTAATATPCSGQELRDRRRAGVNEHDQARAAATEPGGAAAHRQHQRLIVDMTSTPATAEERSSTARRWLTSNRLARSVRRGHRAGERIGVRSGSAAGESAPTARWLVLAADPGEVARPARAICHVAVSITGGNPIPHPGVGDSP